MYPPFKRPTILIVDDEELIREALMLLLQEKYHVLQAGSADEAREVLHENPVSVILTDQRLPGQSGVEFLASIREAYPDAIRMMLTGYADLQSAIAAINDGSIQRYMVKPWNPHEMLVVVAEAVEKHNLLVQNRALVEELKAANARLEQRITERTAELAAANDALRELNRLKDEFLAITSHDLRSPLGNIVSASTLLLSPNYKFSEEEQNELLLNIQDTSRHLINLVSDMLDLAKIESGQMSLDLSSLLLSEVAAQSVEALNFNARIKHITISLETTPGEIPIQGDKLKLYRVINNLISNGINFTPEEGSVTLTIAPEEGGMRLSVRDTGLGIAAQDMPKLFIRYRQTRTRPTTGEKGTGLGLAIVKQLVELHGGQIEVQSEIKQGSTFTIHLPQIPPAGS